MRGKNENDIADLFNMLFCMQNIGLRLPTFNSGFSGFGEGDSFINEVNKTFFFLI